jgi:hypothetical protein
MTLPLSGRSDQLRYRRPDRRLRPEQLAGSEKQFAREVAERSDAGGGVLQRVRLAARVLDEGAQIVRRKRKPRFTGR